MQIRIQDIIIIIFFLIFSLHINTSFAQTHNSRRKITGYVLDNNKEPIVGAILISQNSENSSKSKYYTATTDHNGHFELLLPHSHKKLEVRMLSFKPKIIKLNDKTKNLSIILEANNDELDNVVITGFVDRKKNIQFNIKVESVNFNKGLLLLSSTSEGSMLSFKNVSPEKMANQVSTNIFKSLNPGLTLGSKALSINWMGSSLTNVGGMAIDKTTDLDIYLSTGEPTKVYAIDPQTMLSKAEVTYNGSAANFQPNFIFIPKGFQNYLWNGTIYFLGDGRDYIMAINENGSREFVEANEFESLPEGAKIAEMAYTGVGNYGPIRSYFDLTTKSFIQMEAMGIFYDGSEDEIVGTVEMNNFDVTPINILPCDGEYCSSTGNNKSYDAMNMLLVGNKGDNVTVYQIKPMDIFADFGDTILSTTDATGHISTTSATGVNPTSPLLYYSTKDNKIGVLNYTSASFNDSYIDLGGNYEVKQITFNTYDANTMYIAANNLDEISELKATIFVYDITDKTTAKQLFKGEKAGGSVKQLIYKGNGDEYLTVE